MKKLEQPVVRRIFSLHKKGKSEREIARELGVSRSAVWGWLQRGSAVLAAFAFVFAPLVSSAAVYEYVNTSGQLASVEASTLAEAEILAVNRAPNSGFLLSNAATAPAPSSSTATIAALRAQIAALEAQLAALLSSAPSEDGINEGMANGDEQVASSTPKTKAQKRVEREDKKEKVKDRGVAIAKAHVYAEDDRIFVSLTDFVEGDEVSVVGEHDGESLTISENDSCGGKVAGSDLVLCSKEASFPAPEEGDVKITITVEDVSKSFSIKRGSSGGWLSWE